MFQTGIYTLDQLKNPKNLKTVFGNEKKISITLYNELVKENYSSDLAEKILLNFTDARGAFKRTYSNRFEEFDTLALEIIKEHFSSDKLLNVHDTAISDGRTACNFFLKLKQHYADMKYYASDYDPYIYVIEEGNKKVVINREGIPLECTLPPLVLNLVNESIRYPVNRVLGWLLKKTVLKRIIAKHKNGILKSKEYTLFCPEANEVAMHNPCFKLCKYNLLDPSFIPEKIHIFRAMNILNPSYFTASEFGVIINNIFNALSDKGIFIAGSNQGAATPLQGGIYQKVSDHFRKIGQASKAPYIEELIGAYRAGC